jgi:hypothetical protein
MKRIELTPVRPPVNAASPIIAEQLYTVILGNHWRAHFTSDRLAQAFAAEAERMVNEQLFITNLLVIEAFAAYRLTWPMFMHNKPGGKAKELLACDAAARDHVKGAWEAMDFAITHTHGENGPFRAWKYVADAAGHIRALALDLASLYRRKSDGVDRARMDVLVSRCNAVLETLKHFGSDVATAVKVSPSPYKGAPSFAS